MVLNKMSKAALLFQWVNFSILESHVQTVDLYLDKFDKVKNYTISVSLNLIVPQSKIKIAKYHN